MLPTRTSTRLILLIALALFISLSTAGVFKIALEAVLPASPLLQKLVRFEAVGEGYEYDFGRASRRYLLVVTLVVFVVMRRLIPWSEYSKLGFAADPRPFANARYGGLVGLVLVIAYAAALLLSGQALGTLPGFGYLLRKTLEYAAAAVLIAMIEELFFRGLLFRSLVRERGVATAIVAGSLIFAVLHCISGSLRVAPGWAPGIGLDLLSMYFTDSTGSVLPDLRLVAGLFLLGWLLAYLYLRTDSLWAPVGLHAGIVFFSKLMKKLLQRSEDIPEWLFGDSIFIVSGMVCWLLLLLALAFVARHSRDQP